MKRLCCVLAALMMLCCAALASELEDRALLEGVAALYDAYGEYDAFPKEGYRQAAKLLRDAGVLEGAKSETGGALLDALAGTSSRLIKRVAVSLWGDDDLWTQDNAYWYTEMMLAHGLLLSVDKVYMMPDRDAVSAAEAERAALARVKQRYNVDPAAMTGARTHCTYYAPRATAVPRWKVVFCAGESRLFTVEVDKQGNVGEATMHLIQERRGKWDGYTGLIAMLSLEEQAEYAAQFNIPLYGFPGDGDLPEEKAREIARAALAGRGISPEPYDEHVSFRVTGWEELEFPHWGIYYTDKGGERSQCSVLVSAGSGEVLDIEVVDRDAPGKG